MSAVVLFAWTDDRIDTRETRSNGSPGRGLVPMHELVRSILHSRLFSALRFPSFAGEGLPERMRSISFALLGLTAAAGLALVAIFAQLSFPVLSPAPLPDEPSLSESIGDARKLTPDRPAVVLVAAHPARSGPAGGGSSTRQASQGSSGSPGSSGGVQSSPTPAEVEVAPPVGSPQPSSGGDNGNGGGGADNGTVGGPNSAPAAAPGQPAASSPASKPSPPPSAPAPEATTSASKPEPAPAPGNSSSAAAAAHASERGIDASAGAGPPGSSATTASTPSPEASPQPGNGNGLAKGHDK